MAEKHIRHSYRLTVLLCFNRGQLLEDIYDKWPFLEDIGKPFHQTISQLKSYAEYAKNFEYSINTLQVALAGFSYLIDIEM